MRIGRKIVIAGVSALVVSGGGTAAAAAIMAGSPVDSSGVVHGCWSNTAVNGSHVFVLQDAGANCPKGTTAISWNQSGPQGPAGSPGPSTAGPSGLDVIIVRATNGPPPVLNGTVTALCPADHPYLLGGGGDAANHQSPVKFSAPTAGGEPATGPEGTYPPNGWYVGLVDQSVVAYAWAICAK